MKKLLLWLVVAGFLVGNVGSVRCAEEEGSDQQKMTKEQRKEEKRRHHEERKHEKEMKKEQKSKDHEMRKEEDRRKHEEREHERQLKKEQRAKDHEMRKEEDRRRHEERKHEKELKKEERRKESEMRNEERKEKERISKEKHERRRLEREAKHKQHEERWHARCEHRKLDHKKGIEQSHAKRHEKYDKVRHSRANREVLINSWKHSHQTAVDHARAEGKYASLYKSPSWPTYAKFFEGGKDLFDIGLTYKYACDCYDSTGCGSKSSITKLAFGEQPITWSSILLAKKLLDAGKVGSANGSDLTSIGNGDTEIGFHAKEDSWRLNLGLSRYFISDVIAVGVDLPIVYKKHRLNTILQEFQSAPLLIDKTTQDLYAPTMFKKILEAKGMTELGGSAMGLGDVSAYLNAQINSVAFDKLVVGLRGQFPTGKKATQRKLWAPELGNGGWTEFAIFSAALVSYAKYFNPHLMIEASFSIPAHVSRRVPHWVASPAGAQGGTQVGSDLMAFGDRIIYTPDTGAANSFEDWDTTTKGFGDDVTTVRITKGAEFKFRLGNMFERFILTRSFLDLFYDFRGKQKDTICGLDIDLYNVDMLRQHTQELEHRIGFEYSYQFDLKTRLRLGMLYTFAGMNVPKTFEANGSFNYAF